MSPFCHEVAPGHAPFLLFLVPKSPLNLISWLLWFSSTWVGTIHHLGAWFQKLLPSCNLHGSRLPCLPDLPGSPSTAPSGWCHWGEFSPNWSLFTPLNWCSLGSHCPPSCSQSPLNRESIPISLYKAFESHVLRNWNLRDQLCLCSLQFFPRVCYGLIEFSSSNNEYKTLRFIILLWSWSSEVDFSLYWIFLRENSFQ
jgi:hypothetical protein